MTLRSLAAVIAVACSSLTVTAQAEAAAFHENCTAFNKKFPHGVGRNNARDHTSGTPVTTFKRSTKMYNAAMRANSRLDGDKDGVACEKA